MRYIFPTETQRYVVNTSILISQWLFHCEFINILTIFFSADVSAAILAVGQFQDSYVSKCLAFAGPCQ
jgi:hypothetical protein